MEKKEVKYTRLMCFWLHFIYYIHIQLNCTSRFGLIYKSFVSSINFNSSMKTSILIRGLFTTSSSSNWILKYLNPVFPRAFPKNILRVLFILTENFVSGVLYYTLMVQKCLFKQCPASSPPPPPPRLTFFLLV